MSVYSKTNRFHVMCVLCGNRSQRTSKRDKGFFVEGFNKEGLKTGTVNF